jgi:uncharacterized protein (TIGR02452 family)
VKEIIDNKDMIKEERAKKAKEHYEQMNEEFRMEILSSIKNSKVYRFCKDNGSDLINNTKYYFERMTSTEAAMKYNAEENGKCCLLNYASFSHPGGGFLKGSTAQEEALCGDSFLYNVLESFENEYEYNRKTLKLHNNGLYSNFAIYSPEIVFVNPKNPEYVFDYDVLTCPAPNKKVYLERTQESSEYYSSLFSRVEFLLNVAADNDVETLVLGAFGCGVFANKLEDVARAFKHFLPRYNFKHVIFAIPEQDKLDRFQKAFNKIYSK